LAKFVEIRRYFLTKNDVKRSQFIAKKFGLIYNILWLNAEAGGIMKIKAKQVFFVGAFIVLTVVGYFVMPKDELVINLESNPKGADNSASKFEIGGSEYLANKETIFVHIEGAVNSPGIKEVPKGTRIFEVINLASGECVDADVSKINLASIVKDEQKIYVPFKSAELDTDGVEGLSSGRGICPEALQCLGRI